MPFKGVTFSGQNVTPKNDGGLYNAHYGDGVLWGCSMNISGDDLVIQSGEFIMGGRVVQVDGATSVDLSGRTLQTGYIRVIMNADLSQGEGSQWYTTFDESATTTFPALTQDNINGTDTLYQLRLAIVQISGGNLTNIVTSLNTSRLVCTALDGTYLNINATPNYNSIQSFDANATPMGGIASDLTGSFPQAEVFAGSGGRIMFRPNGQGNTTAQVYIDSAGQFHGGCRHWDASQSGTISVTNASSWYKICSVQNVEVGTYLAYGSYGFTGAGYSTQSFSYIGIGASSGGWSLFNPQVRMATATQYSLQNQIASPYYVSSTQSEVSLWGMCQYVGATIKNGYMTLIRIA